MHFQLLTVLSFFLFFFLGLVHFFWVFSCFLPAGQQNKIFLPSVSNAIMLASALGIIEAVALSTGSNLLMNTMGIPVVCLCLANQEFCYGHIFCVTYISLYFYSENRIFDSCCMLT